MRENTINDFPGCPFPPLVPVSINTKYDQEIKRRKNAKKKGGGEFNFIKK